VVVPCRLSLGGRRAQTPLRKKGPIPRCRSRYRYRDRYRSRRKCDNRLRLRPRYRSRYRVEVICAKFPERSSKPGYPETLAQLSIDDLVVDLVVDVDLDLDMDLDRKSLQEPIPPSMVIRELALAKGEQPYIDMAI
jgi:hypothetical protein